MRPLERMTNQRNRPIIAGANKNFEEGDDQNLCITIPLKGGQKNVGPNGQPGGALTEDFLKAI